MTIFWEDIEAVAGSRLGKFDAACPSCGPDCKSPANRIRKVLRIWRDEPDFASYSCARCGAKGWVRPDTTGAPCGPSGVFARAFLAPSRETAENAKERVRKAAFAEFTLFAADDITGTLAETYLANRGLAPGDDLRFSKAAPISYDGGQSAPAMIAAVRGQNGALVGIQATYLAPDGAKLRRTSFGQVVGGVVRLAPVAANGVLAVAEGVETALAFTALYGAPCWATLGASALQLFEPPPGLTRLIVAADHDGNSAGFNAAQKLARRASAECEVAISMPMREGDWNDVLRQGRVAA